MQADSLALVFEYQKDDQYDESITQSKMDDPILCPVWVGATIICRLLQAMGASGDTFIYTFVRDSDGKWSEQTSKAKLDPSIFHQMHQPLQIAQAGSQGYRPPFPVCVCSHGHVATSMVFLCIPSCYLVIGPAMLFCNTLGNK